MQPTFYNTLSKTQEPFEPRVAGRVKLFTCGPSVYRRQHLGNYRTYLFEDVLHKYLEYQGYTVERLLNFTDVEDKAVEEARAKGLSLEELRRPVEEAFFQESTRLNIWWDTAIGRGRPAWNIQDAAMIRKHLGEEIDIHTGGVDNLYRGTMTIPWPSWSLPQASPSVLFGCMADICWLMEKRCQNPKGMWPILMTFWNRDFPPGIYVFFCSTAPIVKKWIAVFRNWSSAPAGSTGFAAWPDRC